MIHIMLVEYDVHIKKSDVVFSVPLCRAVRFNVGSMKTCILYFNCGFIEVVAMLVFLDHNWQRYSWFTCLKTLHGMLSGVC